MARWFSSTQPFRIKIFFTRKIFCAASPHLRAPRIGGIFPRERCSRGCRRRIIDVRCRECEEFVAAVWPTTDASNGAAIPVSRTNPETVSCGYERDKEPAGSVFFDCRALLRACPKLRLLGVGLSARTYLGAPPLLCCGALPTSLAASGARCSSGSFLSQGLTQAF